VPSFDTVAVAELAADEVVDDACASTVTVVIFVVKTEVTVLVKVTVPSSFGSHDMGTYSSPTDRDIEYE
jgi:hypothetical protein